MKRKTRNVAREIIEDLAQLHAAVISGHPLQQKYTVRTVRAVPDPQAYDKREVRRTRDLIGVSQPVFAQMLGVSPALVRAWENGQRKPAPIARRLLDVIRERPAHWRSMINAA